MDFRPTRGEDRLTRRSSSLAWNDLRPQHAGPCLFRTLAASSSRDFDAIWARFGSGGDFPPPGDEELRNELVALSAAVELWERCLDGDFESAGKACRKLSRSVPPEALRAAREDVELHGDAAGPLTANPGFHPERHRLQTDAAAALTAVVREKLERFTVSRISLELGTLKLTNRAYPVEFMGVVWLEFAAAIAGGEAKYRKCPVCGLYFALGPRATRVPRKYCSGACKTRAGRMGD